MKVTIVGLNHDLQWKDPRDRLRQVLADIFDNSPIDLVAEEAYNLPTTVAQRLACKMNKPWLDVDMNYIERKESGIDEELKQLRSSPIFENGDFVGETHCYLNKADEVREQHWITKLLRQRVSNAILICGLLHVGPVTTKLQSKGCIVEEVHIANSEWYTADYGTCTIVEENGKRWCEILRKQ